MAYNFRDDKGDERSKGAYGSVNSDAEEFYKAGLFLLKNETAREALVAFRRAHLMKETDPRYMSYYGLCLALGEKRIQEAVALCESAVKRDFVHADLFLNLGRVYLLAGSRWKAHRAFQKGLSLDTDNRDIHRELDRMGSRRPPVLPFLERSHPINKLAGKLLYKLRH